MLWPSQKGGILNPAFPMRSAKATLCGAVRASPCRENDVDRMTYAVRRVDHCGRSGVLDAKKDSRPSGFGSSWSTMS
jgi:hypothetical protein